MVLMLDELAAPTRAQPGQGGAVQPVGLRTLTRLGFTPGLGTPACAAAGPLPPARQGDEVAPDWRPL